MLGSHLHFLFIGIHQAGVDADLGRGEGGGSDKFQIGIASQFAGQPNEWLLKVIITLGTNIIILEILLAMEGDTLGLYLAFLKRGKRGEAGVKENHKQNELGIYLNINLVTT